MKKFNEPVIEVVEFASMEVSTLSPILNNTEGNDIINPDVDGGGFLE